MSADGSTGPGSDSAESGQHGTPATELARGLSLGRYVVLERLGAGGMGVVYAAYDPELDRKVAIKLLRPDRNFGLPADRSTRLLQEAKVLARLSHPNVVTVHDVGTFLGQVFIAMEFIGGGTLGQWLTSTPPWREVLACFVRAGEGLAAAHAQGLVHRDFKPDNVLLDAHREPRVTDFGLAREGGAQTENGTTGRVAGTEGYLAPEQARRSFVDARSDQFSFCVSLYLGLYDEPPFPRDLDWLRPLPALKPPRNGSPVPGWLRKVVLRGLSEDPRDRFPSMRELLSALSADPARARREWMTRGSGALVTLCLVAGGAFLASRETGEQRDERECRSRVDSRYSALWSAPRRSTIQQAFHRSRGAAGDDTWLRVTERLNPEMERWREVSRAACVPQRDAVASARWTSCLEERRKTLQGMTDLFSIADPTVVDNALNTIILEVVPATSCRESGPATTRARNVSSTADEQIRSGLARARVLRAAGKYTDGIRAVLEAESDPRLQEANNGEAEALLLKGELYAELHLPDAEETLKATIVAAEKVSNDELRAGAWIALVSWYSDRHQCGDTNAIDRKAYGEAQLADIQAEAILQRVGDRPLLQAARLNAAGLLAQANKKPQLASDLYRQALEKRRTLLPEEHPLIAGSKTNLGLSLLNSEGIAMLREVLSQREQIFGPAHPETANARHNLGLAFHAMNDSQAALGQFEAALKIRQSASPDPARIGRERAVIALELEHLQRFEEAAANAEQAAGLLKEGGATDQEQSCTLSLLLELKHRLKRPSSELAEVEKQLELLELH